MVKYRISKNISIISPVDYEYSDIPEEYLQEHYILVDKINNKEFLINGTIKYFIDKFALPKTQTEVLDEIAIEVQSSKKVIKKNCTSFFKLLCKREIVVPENQLEKNNVRQPLFKAGGCIGNYCIQKVIADKHNIDIYLATNQLDNAAYVIKLLNPDKAPDKRTYEEDLVDLKYEYEMLKSVNHIPFLCQAYDFHEEKPAYIILEYITGKPLKRFLRQTEKLNELDCFIMIENILQGFSLLHESKLIHGDIHPSNILVEEDKTIKIIDLGLSINVNVENDQMIRFGGVQHYMPPERINISSHDKFSGEPDFYSEVYQIGLLIYIVFYLDDPFSGFIWEDLASNIKEGKIEYPALSFQNFPVSTKAIEIMKKCLYKNPVKRYRNAAEILEDFRKIKL